MKKYIAKHIVAYAKQWNGEKNSMVIQCWDNDPRRSDCNDVMTKRGWVPIKPGDYIVLLKNDDVHVESAKVFESFFEVSE